MKKLFLVPFLAVVFGAVSLAGEEKAEPKKEESPARSEPVLCRLGLSDKQVESIDKLFAERGTKMAELIKDRAEAKKLRELVEEYAKKTRELLTAEQQPKFDAGLEVIKDYKKKEIAAAKGEDDGGKKVKALEAEMEKALDEKVGKKPEAPKSGGETPKK